MNEAVVLVRDQGYRVVAVVGCGVGASHPGSLGIRCQNSLCRTR